MFHSFKKNVANATAPKRGINPGGEFLDFKNRLATIKKNLQYVDRKMDESFKVWNAQLIEQRVFSQRFSNGYPVRGDETDAIAKEFAHSSQTVYDHFLRNAATETDTHKHMHSQLKAYIKEITTIESMYGTLKMRSSEAERYQSKVDAMDRRGKKDDLKRSRNLQKMDHEKLMLAEATREVVTEQKKAYAKASTVYKTALCAYWTAHEQYTEVVADKMQKTTEFAKDAEEELGQLDITQMLLFESVTNSDRTMDKISGRSSEVGEGVEQFSRIPSTIPDPPQVKMEVEDDIEEIGDRSPVLAM